MHFSAHKEKREIPGPVVTRTDKNVVWQGLGDNVCRTDQQWDESQLHVYLFPDAR